MHTAEESLPSADPVPRRPGVLVGLGVSFGVFAAFTVIAWSRDLPEPFFGWGLWLFLVGELGALVCVGKKRGRLAVGVALGTLLGATVLCGLVFLAAAGRAIRG